MIKLEDLTGKLKSYPLEYARLMCILQWLTHSTIDVERLQRYPHADGLRSWIQWGQVYEWYTPDTWDAIVAAVVSKRFDEWAECCSNDVSVHPYGTGFTYLKTE